MGEPVVIFGFVFCILIDVNKGQLIPQEEQRNVTSCDLTVDVDLSCGSGEVIAVHSLYFWYHVTCDGICCSYDSSHFSAGADESVIQGVRRQCSGWTACSVGELDGIRDFGSAGPQEPSYVVIKYYCIPASRTTSICSNYKLTSAGEVLYLTNSNYPSVTTGDSTCSCSLEVFSCTSSVNLYMIDADMYLNEANCEQYINIINGTGTSLHKINCSNYYENTITEINFDTNYIKIDFIDDSTQDQEGYFFLGFGVSGDVAFKLNCSYEEQATCRDCGVPGLISHGRLNLANTSNSSYGALANVVCDNRYESDNATVRCLDTGLWELVACSLKDCGSTYGLEYGKITLTSNVTNVGAVAAVTCNTGYTASLGSIRCLQSGEWEIATCTIKDCGNPASIQYGNITLLDDASTTYNSTARVACQGGYNAKKQVVTCKESGEWEKSSCEPKEEEQQAADEDATTIILLSVLIPIAVCLCILILYFIWRYRHSLCKNSSSKGHERVSFKNEEVLPEDKECQTLNLSFVNENAIPKDQLCQDSNESSKTENNIPKDKRSKDANESTNTVDMLLKQQHIQDPNISVKTEAVLETKQCQDSRETSPTGELVPEKEKSQNSIVKTEGALPEKQPSQDSDVL